MNGFLSGAATTGKTRRRVELVDLEAAEPTNFLPSKLANAIAKECKMDMMTVIALVSGVAIGSACMFVVFLAWAICSVGGRADERNNRN